MTLSDLSIKNPVFAWMLMIGLIVFGAIGFERMGVSQLPDIDFPVITTQITWEGAAPDIMETDVADVVEDAVMGVEGVKNVTSVSQQGQTTVTVEFNLNRNIDAALQDVQTKIAQAQRLLPKDIDPPITTKTNPEDQPIMWLALSGSRPLKDLTRYIKEHLKDDLTTAEGVGEIRLGGYVDPNLRVWLDARKMQGAELTVEDVLQAINLQHAEVPAGYIDTGLNEMNVRVLGEAASPEEFSNLVIPTRVRGAPIWTTFHLRDVGTVEDGLADVRRISRTGGQAAVGLGIVKQRGTNAVAVAEAVKAKLAQIEKRLPQGMRITTVFDTTQFIKDSVHELNRSLVLSAVVTSLVCYLFLGSWSATLNVLLAIPTAVMGSFIALYFMGFTLNTFTMLGLALVIGVIVDDAIMVLENISRYREHGQTRVRAALVGAREITFAALAASVAILAIFVPVIFMPGVVGKFFYQFGITISVAVMLSLLEALTIAPMRCSQFLEVGNASWVGRVMDRFMTWLTETYRRTLNRALDHRWLVLAAASGFFVISLGLAKTLKKEFVPPQDQSRFLVRLTTPLGTSIEETDKLFRQAEALMMANPNIDKYYAAVGGFTGGQVNTGFLFVTMKPPAQRTPFGSDNHPITQQEYMGVARKELSNIPGLDRVIMQDLSLSGFTAQRGFPIEFTVRGPEWDKLADYSRKIMDRMKESGLMTDIDTDYQLGMPEVKVYPDREKAARRGVDIRSIGDTINAMIGGVRNGKYTGGSQRYDIRVRLVESDRSKPSDISRIWVRNNHGEVVRLSDVVTLAQRPTLFSITRWNRERAVSVFANPSPGKSQAEAIDAVQRIGAEVLPSGYRLVLSGSSQTFKESFGSLIFVLVLGIFVAYMVLGSQFNSFIHPFTVLLALPFSVTGAFIALAVRGQSLNLYSMIGLILLMGIVKKNSILLVDFTNERRKAGEPPREALLSACPIRLRPILMTSVATMAAAIPEALATGSGSETMVPMAVVIIGGVLVSTFLTLYVVPCAYSLLARVESHKHDQELREALVELGELEPGKGEPTHAG